VWTAGLLLALSFALLAIIPLATFQEFGGAMAIGHLLDAFIVQSLLAPGLLRTFGKWSAWPNRSVTGSPKP
jgi:RND superfamily putative drug exporter